jgi:hypothetical protein
VPTILGGSAAPDGKRAPSVTGSGTFARRNLYPLTLLLKPLHLAVEYVAVNLHEDLQFMYPTALGLNLHYQVRIVAPREPVFCNQSFH